MMLDIIIRLKQNGLPYIWDRFPFSDITDTPNKIYYKLRSHKKCNRQKKWSSTRTDQVEPEALYCQPCRLGNCSPLDKKPQANLNHRPGLKHMRCSR